MRWPHFIGLSSGARLALLAVVVAIPVITALVMAPCLAVIGLLRFVWARLSSGSDEGSSAAWAGWREV